MVEAAAELGVAIVNQQAQRLLAISKCHQQVARLLGCPGGRAEILPTSRVAPPEARGRGATWD
jgi:hypothetical protein